MLNTSLILAQRMIAIGMDETEVAQELISALIRKYGMKTEDEPFRMVCKNTITHSTIPEFQFKDESWHGIETDNS